MSTVRPWVLIAAAVGLFLVWSNSFVAIGYLLGADRSGARFDWIGLTVIRFAVVLPVCAVYCFGLHRRESLDALRTHWRRVIAGGIAAVPAYNLALYYGQQHGVPAPIASLTTALLPLFVLVMAAAFLGERLTVRRGIGFVISVAGMILVALARRDGGGTYGATVAITALAPLSWSLYSVISKPLAGRVSPLVWTYLTITVGSVLLLPLLPGEAWRQARALDGPGWIALLYLSLPCTVLGFAVWTWLLKLLPASTVGLTVFLNPPLTTLSKLGLAALVPTVFVFTVQPQEIAGGTLALAGLAVAGLGGRRRR